MDNFDPALISVVMPCHNAAPYVGEAIASVLGQSYPQVELIVVDDGSTDGSSDILQRLAAENPERITLIYQNRSGPFAARNAALARANGNYIAFLDADDAWHPDALRLMHDALETTRPMSPIAAGRTSASPPPTRTQRSRPSSTPTKQPTIFSNTPLADQQRADPPPC
jgi:glycosyltransferase involved in cell wall biosynthesis